MGLKFIKAPVGPTAQIANEKSSGFFPETCTFLELTRASSKTGIADREGVKRLPKGETKALL